MSPGELAAWEERLRAREVDLDGREQPGEVVLLPAAPVRGVLLHLLEDRRVGGMDADELASGLGLDRELVVATLAGERQSLGVPEIKAVCEALHASPFDLWSPDEARRTLGAYGPEQWPRYIEPIDDLYEPPPSEFVTRRVAQQAGGLVDLASRAGQLSSQLPVVVTPYRQVGVLSVDGGRVEAVADPHAAASPRTDYFFTFDQLGRPMDVDVQVDGGALPSVAPAGLDAPPALTEVARRLQEWTPGVSMVRFTDPASGDEHWVGRDPSAGTWTSWDDPASGFPGARHEVLRAGEHLDPGTLVEGHRPRLSVAEQIVDPAEPAGLDLL